MVGFNAIVVPADGDTCLRAVVEQIVIITNVSHNLVSTTGFVDAAADAGVNTTVHNTAADKNPDAISLTCRYFAILYHPCAHDPILATGVDLALAYITPRGVNAICGTGGNKTLSHLRSSEDTYGPARLDATADDLADKRVNAFVSSRDDLAIANLAGVPT